MIVLAFCVRRCFLRLSGLLASPPRNLPTRRVCQCFVVSSLLAVLLLLLDRLLSSIAYSRRSLLHVLALIAVLGHSWLARPLSCIA